MISERARHNRLYLFISVLFLMFFLIALRLAFLSLGFGQSLIENAGMKEARAPIYDRRGMPFALSEEKWNIFINTKKEISAKDMPKALELTGLSPEALEVLIKNPKVHLIKRFASEDEAKQIKLSKLDFLLLEKIYERTYPQKTSLGPLLGFAGYEGVGFLGVERQYQNLLTTRTASGLGMGTASTNHVEMFLTIDGDIQYAAERALDQAVKERQAEGGTILIQECETGKILAMASDPSFDPAEFAKTPEKLLRNPAVSDPIEPGSIFKIFFIAMLFERYHIDLDQPYFYSTGQSVLTNGEIIRDARAYGWVSFKDIVKYSINAGMIQACKDFSKQELYDHLLAMQFGKTTGIDLPSESRGIVRPTREWGIRTTATILIGQGLAVTPIQLISSFSAMVNGGIYRRPYILDRYSYENERGVFTQVQQPFEGKRLIRKETSDQILSLLAYGTVKGSTGELARATGYASVGKTGTSQMVNLERGGYYSNRFNALFIAAFPADKPKLTALVIIRDPKNLHTGGQVSAPVFADLLPDIVRRMELPGFKNVESYQNRVLRVSKPESFATGESVPDFIGLSRRDAEIALFRYTKVMSSNRVVVRSEVLGSGYVKNQSPSPGSAALSNTVIRLNLVAP